VASDATVGQGESTAKRHSSVLTFSFISVNWRAAKKSRPLVRSKWDSAMRLNYWLAAVDSSIYSVRDKELCDVSLARCLSTRRWYACSLHVSWIVRLPFHCTHTFALGRRAFRHRGQPRCICKRVYHYIKLTEKRKYTQQRRPAKMA